MHCDRRGKHRSCAEESRDWNGNHLIDRGFLLDQKLVGVSGHWPTNPQSAQFLEWMEPNEFHQLLVRCDGRH